MRKIIFIISIFLFSFGYSQSNLDHKKVGDTVFYKNRRYVSKDEAKEFVIIDSIKIANQRGLYQITAYSIKDINNFSPSRKYTSSTSRLEIMNLEGLTTYYHRNGKVKSQGLKKKGRSIGEWNYWYENERKNREVTFFERGTLKKGKPSLLTNFWDKEGNQTVKDGTGSYSYVSKKDSISYKGSLINGYKDGLWTGRSKHHKKGFDENYKNGKLITGKSWDKEGNHYTYKEEFVRPKFKRGQKGIRKVITDNFKVPKIAIKEKLDGTILVSFEVSKEGTLTNIKVFRKVHPEVDAEAIRVIKLMKGWKPGIRKGKKVKSKFAIPIKYSIKK